MAEPLTKLMLPVIKMADENATTTYPIAALTHSTEQSIAQAFVANFGTLWLQMLPTARDTIADAPAVLSPRNAYFVAVAPFAIGRPSTGTTQSAEITVIGCRSRPPPPLVRRPLPWPARPPAHPADRGSSSSP